MAGERPWDSMSATALVHEVYLRLGVGDPARWPDRAEFFRAAGNAMHQVLVERARARNSRKRGGGRVRVELETVDVPAADESFDWEPIDRAVALLRENDPRKYDIVLLRFYCGLTIEQTAAELGLSVALVNLEWRKAKLWLRESLERDAEPLAREAKGGEGAEA